MANLTKILGGSFDASTVDIEESQRHQLLPAGDYLCLIEDTQMGPTKNGDGEKIVVSLVVLTGSYEGAKIFETLNVVNKSPIAVKKAFEALAKICVAAGKPVIQDTQELHNLRVIATVEVEKGKGTYVGSDGVTRPSGDQNKIKSYRSPNGTAPAAPHAAPAVSQPATSGKPLPWKK
jgi:hypothetical protein